MYDAIGVTAQDHHPCKLADIALTTKSTSVLRLFPQWLRAEVYHKACGEAVVERQLIELSKGLYGLLPHPPRGLFFAIGHSGEELEKSREMK